jgi:hypothetical protein
VAVVLFGLPLLFLLFQEPVAEFERKLPYIKI